MKFSVSRPLPPAVLCVGFALAAFSGPAYVAPSITGVSGQLGHGKSLTITGSGFGSKSPAAPVLWANFESGTLGQSVNEHKPVIGPTVLLDNVGGSPLVGVFDNTNPLHSRSNRHAYLDANPDQGNWTVRLRIPISRTSGDQLYYRFWLKIVYPNGWNDTLNQKPVDIYNSTWHSPVYTGFADVGGFRSGGHASSPTKWAGLNISNIQGQWINYEEEIRVGPSPNGSRRHWVHYAKGPSISELWNGQGMNTWSSPSDDYAWFTVGEYFRRGPVEYWIDEIYVDYTFARVEIGNAPTYDESTRREIQIPTAWSNNSITVTLNQGALSDFSNAYLYVVDRDGTVNAKGFPLSCPECPAAPTLTVD